MPFTQAIGCQGDKRFLLSKPRVAGLPRCTALYTRQCVFLYLNVFHSFAFNYPPCALAEWSCFSIFGQEWSVLFDLQEYVVSLKAVSTSPFLPFFDSLYLLLNVCPSYVTRADEKKSCFGEARLTDKMERTRKRNGTLPADWGNEGLHCTVHCTWWEQTSCYSCRAQVKIKSVCGCVYVCVRRLLTQNKEWPLHGNWLTRCCSCHIQITAV